MSILIFAIVSPLAAELEDYFEWKIREARIARRCPRARRYRFN